MAHQGNRHTNNHKLVFKDLKEVAALVVDALQHYHPTPKKSPIRTVEDAQQHTEAMRQKRLKTQKNIGNKLLEKLKKEEEQRQMSRTPLKDQRSTNSRERTPKQNKATPRTHDKSLNRQKTHGSPGQQKRRNGSPGQHNRLQQPTIHQRSKELLQAREYRLERERFRQEEKQNNEMLSNTFKRHSVVQWLDHINQRQHEHQQQILAQRNRLLDDILHAEASRLSPERNILEMSYKLLEHEKLARHLANHRHEFLSTDTELERDLKLRTSEVERHHLETNARSKEKDFDRPLAARMKHNLQRVAGITPKKNQMPRSPSKQYLPARQMPLPSKKPQPINTSVQIGRNDSAVTFAVDPTLQGPATNNRVSALLSDEELMAVLRQNRDKIFRIVEKIGKE